MLQPEAFNGSITFSTTSSDHRSFSSLIPIIESDDEVFSTPLLSSVVMGDQRQQAFLRVGV